MKDWEFLIQKEGDRIWHPIQQQILEIEEGKYRLVAHSAHQNYEVEIRIFYQYFSQDCSHSETQTHFRRTNSDGLIMLFPFTYLQPGSWKILCYGDIMAELVGDTWQTTIQLQILPKKSNNQKEKLSENREKLEDKELNGTAIDSGTAKSEYYLNKLNQLLQNEIEPMLQVNSAAMLNLQEVQIILDQDSFHRKLEENIAISGKVEAWELPFKGKIFYKLRNPETEKIIFTLDQALFKEILPFKFENILEIPKGQKSPFLLGEVIIESAEGKLLARQEFTIETELDKVGQDITSPINYTIELADTDKDLAIAFDVFISHESSSCSLEVELPNPNKMKKTLQQASSPCRQILPPKLTSPSAGTPKVIKPKSPQLPLRQKKP